MVEYALMVALIAMAVVGSVAALGERLFGEQAQVITGVLSPDGDPPAADGGDQEADPGDGGGGCTPPGQGHGAGNANPPGHCG